MSEVGYSYAVLRAVPRPHLGAFVTVGVVVHARTLDYLGIRVLDDPEGLRERLGRRAAAFDIELMVRYLRSCRAICLGDEAGGPVALAPPSERFHWITSPRSDVLQPSPVHEGVCADPEVALEELWEEWVVDG